MAITIVTNNWKLTDSNCKESGSNPDSGANNNHYGNASIRDTNDCVHYITIK